MDKILRSWIGAGFKVLTSRSTRTWLRHAG